MDARPGSNVRQVGSSRGRWDGDTLVVKRRTRERDVFASSSPNLHLVERFTLPMRTRCKYETP
jgi:hypothetical protein